MWSSRKKVLLVGGQKSGKTKLFECLSGGTFKNVYEPTSSNESEKSSRLKIVVNGEKVIKFNININVPEIVKVLAVFRKILNK
jgi:GTPase SAR1 family protein